MDIVFKNEEFQGEMLGYVNESIFVFAVSNVQSNKMNGIHFSTVPPKDEGPESIIPDFMPGSHLFVAFHDPEEVKGTIRALSIILASMEGTEGQDEEATKEEAKE